MEIYECIKELRKNTLKISQTVFGERLGVNRDVINNMENNRLARPEQNIMEKTSFFLFLFVVYLESWCNYG